jgi:hypothetical protein
MTVDDFMQFPSIAFLTSEHVHEAFGWVAVNFIVYGGLQVCCSAVKSFEFQFM